MTTDPTTDPTTACAAPGLGLDAGGTQTRWALCAADGRLLRDGSAPAMGGLQLASAAGQAEVAALLASIAAQLATPLRAVSAGVTGFDAAQAPLLQPLLAQAFGVPPSAVQTLSDIELACHAAFRPGEGIVVYAGTGAIAALLDSAGTLHRAGGRGAVIDDAGSGHWIATQALRQVWRAEDLQPGAWQASRLAQQLFNHIGGSSWAHSRAWVYGASRGDVGTLALAVAAAAHAGDTAALQILQAAGSELARLGAALLVRCGPLPLALAGRVFTLHPAVEAALRASLPPGTSIAPAATQSPHHAAARLAATRSLPPCASALPS